MVTNCRDSRGKPFLSQLPRVREALPTVRITESPGQHHGCAYFRRQTFHVIAESLKTRLSDDGVIDPAAGSPRVSRLVSADRQQELTAGHRAEVSGARTRQASESSR